MPIISIGKKDIEKGLPLAEGWYTATWKSVTAEPNKKKDGINFTTEFHIDDGSTEGRDLTHWFSTKAIGMIIPFYVATTGKQIVEDSKNIKDFQFDTDEVLGKPLKVHIIKDIYNGLPTNKIDGAVPVNTNTEAPF